MKYYRGREKGEREGEEATNVSERKSHLFSIKSDIFDIKFIIHEKVNISVVYRNVKVIMA